jgi:hypothetical protein
MVATSPTKSNDQPFDYKTYYTHLDLWMPQKCPQLNSAKMPLSSQPHLLLTSDLSKEPDNNSAAPNVTSPSPRGLLAKTGKETQKEKGYQRKKTEK